MAYNEAIHERVKTIVETWNNTAHKKMFGGICHLMEGNMFCGLLKDDLILRLGESAAKEALTLPHVKPFDITGKAMKGWVMVEPDGYESDARLEEWLLSARRFVETLPAK